ncbi:hypothetical protein F5884DRAFT_246117 [Xylogone sp. PMI_703]|nr:hypothetical protein F5884DRAFT_246117 [Xylogone sp. PMI_703]
MKFFSTFHAFAFVNSLIPALSQASCTGSSVANWLYTSDLDSDTETLLDRPDILGVQCLYSWRSLEPQQDQYDFSAIWQDLNTTQSKGKQLWVQIQDRSFYIPNNPVPNYLHKPIYDNGSVPQLEDPPSTNQTGWAAAQWNDNVKARYQLLLKELAATFDGLIYGMNFAESSITIDESANNFTCDGYFQNTLDNALYARSVFSTSYVVQYINFWPCGYGGDGGYLADSFAFVSNHSIGIGGPDDIPYKPGQENNSYPYFDMYRDKVPISVIAVQEPDLNETNPDTGKNFTKAEFTNFATEQLGVDIIFWALSSPWLSE